MSTKHARKYELPGLPDRHLRRERLLRRLAVGRTQVSRVTVVRGGPGTGKTTLLGDYARHAGSPVLWCGLTPADSDPVALAERLLAGFAAVCPGLSRQPSEMLQSQGRAGLAQAFGALCDDLETLASPLLVVLDDAQNLGADEATAAGIDALLRYFPDSGQIVVAGRALPGIKLAGLQLRGQTTEIDETDLAFTVDEVASLLEADMPGEALAAEVFGRTHGWAAGVAYSLRSGSGRALESLARPELLYAYLSEELLQGDPAPLIHALMPYAFLPRVAVASVSLGNRLDALRGFASREGDDLVLNPIFREWLRHEFLTTRAEAEKAAVFRALADASADEDAIRLLLMARDVEAAEGRLVAALGPWLQERRDATIAAALEAFPDAWRERSEWLLAIEGELLRRAGQAGGSLERLRLAETRARAADNRPCLAAAMAAQAAVHGALGEVERQLAAAEDAISQAPQAGYFLGLAHNVLAMGHVARGELDLAELAFKDALEAYRLAGDAGGRARVLHNWGLAHARVGEFERAIATYREALRAAEAGGQWPLAMTCNNLALCLQYLGRPGEAWETAERGMAIAEGLGGRRDRVFLLWTLGLLSMHRGETLKARDYFETSLIEAGPLGDQLSEVNALVGLAEVALAQDDLAGAQHGLDRAVAAAGTTLEDPALVEAATVQAEVEVRRGDVEAATSRLAYLEERLAASPNAYHEFHVARLSRDLAVLRGDAAAGTRWDGRLRQMAERYGYPPAPRRATGAPRTTGAPRGSESGGAPDLGHAPDMAPAAAPEAIEVAFLGPARVVVEGREVTARDWRSANARLVLAFLLSNPAGASKEDLLDLLYPDEEPDRSAIHVLIGRLRNALEPGSKGKPSRFVLFHDGRYRFNQGVHSRYDAAEFRMLLRQAKDPAAPDHVRRQSLERAVALYRGPFLPEFGATPWCQIERENLRRQAMAAYETLFADAAASDDWERLERYADAALAVEPTAQAPHRAKIVALSLLERQEDAERMARLARAVLTRDGAPDLDPETEDLLDRVLERSLTVRSARAALPSADT